MRWLKEFCFFFFSSRRRHTRLQGDWSSDVCSSDLLFTAGAPRAKKLFAEAFAPSDVETLAASGLTSSSAILNGSANPGGASVRVHFDFGATTAYGATTASETLGVAVVPTPFDAQVTGPAGATLHYRAVAASDFTTITSPDATVSIVNEPPVVSVGPIDAV